MTSDISRSQTMYKSQHMPMTQLSPYCAPNTINPNNSFNHIFTKFMNGSLNNLNINTDKTTTLLTANPAKYGTTKQSNIINNKTHKNFWFFTRPKAFNTFTTHKCNDNQNKRMFNIFKALIFFQMRINKT